MSGLKAYKPAGAHIVYQTIDSEVILINLRDGFYFSITNAGTVMWELLIAGLSGNEVIKQVSLRHNADTAEVEKDFLQFIEKLQSEGLIVVNAASEHSALAPPAANSAPPPYKAPVLEKFTDMEDILALDPIHDVSESGWPNR